MFNSLNVRKITENWKIEFDFDHHYNRVRYNYEDTAFKAFWNAEDLENLFVKSLNDHWSAGGEVNFRVSTFSNYRFQFEILPAIEYNIFPYSESTRRQLRMLYAIGYTYYGGVGLSYIFGSIYNNVVNPRFNHY